MTGTKDLLAQNMKANMQIIPNSCLSVLFLDEEVFNIKEKVRDANEISYMEMVQNFGDIPNHGYYGIWFNVRIQLSPMFRRKPDIGSMDLKIFVANYNSTEMGRYDVLGFDGYLGLSPC